MFNITRNYETASKALMCIVFSLFLSACGESGSGSNTTTSEASSNPADTIEAPETVQPVVITKQPESIVLLAGSDAEFTVGATGGGALSVQWRKNGVVIAGETSSSLVLSNVSLAAAGQYSAVVTNSAGSASSLAALLTIQSNSGGPVEEPPVEEPPVEEPPVEEPPVEEPPVEEPPVEEPMASIELNWDIPELREDGSDLEIYEINGYKIVYGKDENNLNSEVSIEGPSNNKVVIDELDAGTYYFAIATVDSDGTQGAFSDHIEQVVL